MTLTSTSLNIRGVRIMLNEKGSLFRQLHISQNAPCLPAKILHKHCFQFLFGRLLNRGRGQTRCIKGAVQMANRPFPSYRYKYSHFRNKAHYRTFLVKMSFICIRIKTRENVAHSLLIKNHCHMNGFALSLALKHRLGATWK